MTRRALDGSVLLVLVLFPVVLLAGQASADVATTAHKLLASDGAVGDRFGRSVAVDGNRIVVGARDADVEFLLQGAAYVYVFAEGTGWVEEAKLTASDGALGDRFGTDVAISGDTILVSAPLAKRVTTNPMQFGKLYAFQRTGPSQWTEQQQLLPSGLGPISVIAPNRHRPQLAFTGDVAAVSVSQSGVVNDSVRIFRFNEITGWTEESSVTNPETVSIEKYPASVATDGVSVAIGVRHALPNGAALATRHGPSGWDLPVELTAANGAPSDELGVAVAAADSYVFVGAPLRDQPLGNSGRVHVFRWTGSQWDEEPVIEPAVPGDNLNFGSHLAARGSIVAITAGVDGGATTHDEVVHIYHRISGSWAPFESIVSPEAGSSSFFGKSAAVSQRWLVAGAELGEPASGGAKGSAYVYDLTAAVPPVPSLSSVALAVLTATMGGAAVGHRRLARER